MIHCFYPLRKNIVFCIFIIYLFSSCSTPRSVESGDNGKIDITFVQVNDVYEIAPLANGTQGGMARVATIKKKYLRLNPNTYLVMAGDFLSPSVYNSLKYEGKAIRGKQMVDVMNAAGMDMAVFGNHELDIKESELQERINESQFQWISSNTFHKQKDNIGPFVKVNSNGTYSPIPTAYIKTIKDADGTTAKIAFIGINIPFTKADYVTYTDGLAEAKKLYTQLKDTVDAVVAITHQLIQDDEILAKEIPGLAVILGGHEHDQRFKKVGNIYITKAMANAKSAYVVTLHINKNKHTVKVEPSLEVIDSNVPIDSATNTVVQKWVTIAANSYATLGFDAKKVVLNSGEPLNGLESEIRTHPTNLTKMIMAALANAVPQANVVIMNSGSIRVDDILPTPVTQYDIIRALPFGGGLREVDMKGNLLVQVLDQGMKNKGIGGYLLYNEDLQYDINSGTWKLKGVALDPASIYHVGLTDFLLTGGEANLGYLTTTNKDIVKVYEAVTSLDDPRSDIRRAIFKYLEKK
jgi:2',3'-cyclic-nucleotide 2'-phosphodiesterase (5'-nucleotidase family)